MKENLLCRRKQSCISCCTRGIERFTKEELDEILENHSREFKKSKGNLDKYIRSIPKNKLVCEYLSKKGCLIHPTIIKKEIRHKAPKNNFFRGKCRDSKTCNKEILLKELPKNVREKLRKELDRSKDYYEYSIKIKHLIPRVYVKQKIGKLNGFTEWWLSRICREPEQKQCFRLKSRLDFLIKIAKILNF